MSKPKLPPPPEPPKEVPVLTSPEADAAKSTTGRLRAGSRRGLRIDRDEIPKPSVGLNIPT